MLFTQIAGADQFKKAQMGLSDQAWYDRYVAPYARQAYTQAVGEGGAAERGAKLRQGQIVASQFGGQPTSMGEAAVSSMAPTFRKAMQESIQRAQAESDRLTAKKMIEREKEVSEAFGNVSLTNQLEAGLAALIPYAGPYISGGTTAGGAIMKTGAQGARQQANTRPLRTVQFSEAGLGGGGGGGGASRGGGGLYDLYNLTYG
jgi:hypothetical protein